MTETKEFKMAPKKMFSVLLMHYGMPWIVAAIAGAIIFIILGAAINLKFFFLALIWIFMVIPLMTAFLYFFYGMQPLTAFNSIPHKVIFSERELRVRLTNNEISENVLEKGVQDNLSIREQEIEKRDFTLPYSFYNNIKSGGDYILLFFNKNGFLWLPINAFDSTADFKKTVNIFTQNQ